MGAEQSVLQFHGEPVEISKKHFLRGIKRKHFRPLFARGTPDGQHTSMIEPLHLCQFPARERFVRQLCERPVE